MMLILKDYRGRTLFNISISSYLLFGLGMEGAFRLEKAILPVIGGVPRQDLPYRVSNHRSLKNAIFSARRLILTARLFLFCETDHKYRIKLARYRYTISLHDIRNAAF